MMLKKWILVLCCLSAVTFAAGTSGANGLLVFADGTTKQAVSYTVNANEVVYYLKDKPGIPYVVASSTLRAVLDANGQNLLQKGAVSPAPSPAQQVPAAHSSSQATQYAPVSDASGLSGDSIQHFAGATIAIGIKEDVYHLRLVEVVSTKKSAGPGGTLLLRMNAGFASDFDIMWGGDTRFGLGYGFQNKLFAVGGLMDLGYSVITLSYDVPTTYGGTMSQSEQYWDVRSDISVVGLVSPSDFVTIASEFAIPVMHYYGDFATSEMLATTVSVFPMGRSKSAHPFTLTARYEVLLDFEESSRFFFGVGF